MTTSIAVLAGLAAITLYAFVRFRQHRELEKAYRFAHEQTHDTDRGYYPDKYTGMGWSECVEIARRFREAEERWFMFGARRERARTERRIAVWMVYSFRDDA